MKIKWVIVGLPQFVKVTSFLNLPQLAQKHFNPWLTCVLVVLYTHMTLGEQKNRDEEPVQVHTSFVIEHHSSVETCHTKTEQFLYIALDVYSLYAHNFVGAFTGISRPPLHSCHLQYKHCGEDRKHVWIWLYVEWSSCCLYCVLE